MIRLNRKGQNTLEYVLLITAVVVAFLIVQHYLGRGVQGRVREASDNIGNQFDADLTAAQDETTRSSKVNEIQEQISDATTGMGGIKTTSKLVDEAESNIRRSAEEVAKPDGTLPTLPALPVIPETVPGG